MSKSTTSPSIESLEELLKTTAVTVEFKKVSDGSIRTMICTKNFELIPEEDYPVQETSPAAKNDDIIRVYDMESMAWRSFRKDSVIKFDV